MSALPTKENRGGVALTACGCAPAQAQNPILTSVHAAADMWEMAGVFRRTREEDEDPPALPGKWPLRTNTIKWAFDEVLLEVQIHMSRTCHLRMYRRKNPIAPSPRLSVFWTPAWGPRPFFPLRTAASEHNRRHRATAQRARPPAHVAGAPQPAHRSPDPARGRCDSNVAGPRA